MAAINIWAIGVKVLAPIVTATKLKQVNTWTRVLEARCPVRRRAGRESSSRATGAIVRAQQQTGTAPTVRRESTRVDLDDDRVRAWTVQFPAQPGSISSNDECDAPAGGAT